MLKSRAPAIAIFSVLCAFFCLALANAQSRTTFPGKKSISKSPNGRYVIHNVDDDKLNPPHRLELEDSLTSSKVKLLDYDKSVEVLWSPAGSKFIVVDHAGSNLTESYVFVVDKSLRRINITDELQQKYPDSKHLFQNDHVFVEAVSWLKEDRIKIKVSGQGVADPNGFTEFFEYTLGGDFKKVSK
jgi:hypothetical protein